MAAQSRNYTVIVALIYLLLPYTLIKQKLFWRFRKPAAKLPDFICIGAQKSATTWLHHQLSKHPRICMPAEKEIHYFDWFFYRSLAWYEKKFQNCGSKIRGEVTPGYSVIETGRVKFMRRIMPKVKIILILRDPAERAWSSARFHFAKELQRPLTGVTNEEFIRHFNKSWVQKRGDYAAILSRWKKVIPSENILVILHEELTRNPRHVMDVVHRFLGVEENSENITETRYNVSAEMKMPDEIREHLRNYYRSMVFDLQQHHQINTSLWRNYNPE